MKILLPVDGSKAAREAVDFVRSLAKVRPVEVVVSMVSFAPAQHAMQPYSSEWKEQENLYIQKVLDNAKHALDVDCQSVSIIHGAGSVVPCILDQARDSKVDLIVMGAKGLSTTKRSHLGSVSDNIATRADCSVVVVRPGRRKNQHLGKILLAFDKSAASREAASELLLWKLSGDTHISVVSVAQTPSIFTDDGCVSSPYPLTPEQISPINDAAIRMASHIAEQHAKTDTQTLSADHIGEAIVEAAEKAEADLIVVGDAGHSRRGDFFLGSTSKYLLRHASCSVWISRYHWKTDAKEAAPE